MFELGDDFPQRWLATDPASRGQLIDSLQQICDMLDSPLPLATWQHWRQRELSAVDQQALGDIYALTLTLQHAGLQQALLTAMEPARQANI